MVVLKNRVEAETAADISAWDSPDLTSLGMGGLNISDGETCRLVLENNDGDYEIILVANDGGAMTCTRGAEETTAREWPAGSRVMLSLTAGALSDYVQQVFDERIAALDGNNTEY